MKEGRLAVKVFYSKQVAHNHLLRTVCLLSLVRSLSLFFCHMHVLVTAAGWLRTAVNLFTFLCVYCAHMLTKCAQPCFVCVCVCVGESELMFEPAFGGVFCSLLINFYFCIRLGTCIFFAYKGCRKSLWRLPLLRCYHVVSIVFPLYTPL